MESAYLPYVKEMKSALLDAERCNVIAVDWSDGAEANSVDSYIQATANARIVGAEIANTINWLIRDLNANAKDFHLIGHSLGAHIAGYAGERISNLGRITGLVSLFEILKFNCLKFDEMVVRKISNILVKPIVYQITFSDKRK